MMSIDSGASITNAGPAFSVPSTTVGGYASRINSSNNGQTVTPPQWNSRPASSNHSGGCQVAMMDGSAKFLNENVDYASFVAATGMKDGRNDDLE